MPDTDGLLNCSKGTTQSVDIQYLDRHMVTTACWHTVSRLTYNMSTDIHTMHVDLHTVFRMTYSMSICRSVLVCRPTFMQYLDRHSWYMYVSLTTYCMSINKLYVVPDTACQCRSNYCMSIGCCTILLN